MHVTCIVGARPNFMKVAPILRAAEAWPDVRTRLVHTGQHYDERMSDLFFDQLGLPHPDIHLGVGSGSHAAQTARVMLQFDETLDHNPTDLVIVVGDVNSTLACALVAVKRNIPVAHVEAGLRSGDRRMPEEINRVLTDQISDLLFTTERSAADNLRAEGIAAEKIHFVGNVMIDTLYRHRERARQSDVLSRLGLTERRYAVSTLHRPSNVDTEADALNTVRALEEVARRLPVVVPLHPRTRLKLEEFRLLDRLLGWPAMRILEPLGYFEFLALVDRSALVFTDSGGIQEETTALGVPCLTFRDSTERPITITHGTNRLVGLDPIRVAAALADLLTGHARQVSVPELWDGHAAERIWTVLRQTRSARSDLAAPAQG
ncbi:MAG: UDP-N-acetylglucosamine 2-epimerase (non-hydrolyzing) [Acidobacteria bacterium]|nr:UDP-N-acetylglucosamine 2-epimerase (non-hydrolyzing) [Acidobacteriota bacterium]MCA1649579.1 UDP-N-acetylglucosamine 2-epimerase (non-hydrolyzing) [Acidobacteriota bacterium]